MALTPQNLKKVVFEVMRTRPVELTCGECWQEIDQYAEKTLAGKEIPEALKLVEQHLEICPECEEEFEALLAALRGM